MTAPTNLELWRLATAVQYVYQNDQSVRAFLIGRDAGFPGSRALDVENFEAQGYKDQTATHLFIAGSGDIRDNQGGNIDWQHNFEAFLVFAGIAGHGDLKTLLAQMGGSAAIHAGFANGASTLWPSLKAFCQQAPVNGVWVAGHSLGAALAELIGYGLVKSGIPVTAVVCFAGPRVGDEDYAAKMEEALPGRIFRYSIPGDVVPLVPFGGIPGVGTYTHTGQAFSLPGPPPPPFEVGSLLDVVASFGTRPALDLLNRTLAQTAAIHLLPGILGALESTDPSLPRFANLPGIPPHMLTGPPSPSPSPASSSSAGGISTLYLGTGGASTVARDDIPGF